MAYRDAAPQPVATLDVRPNPRAIAFVLAFCVPFFVVPGVVLSAATFEGQPVSSALLGVPLVLCGVGFFVGAYRMFTTVVRFIVDEQTIRMEWRRGRSVVRTEAFPRDELVGVTIERSDESAMRLVVQTKHRELPLSSGLTSGEAHYLRTLGDLRSFLDVRGRA